VNSADFIGKWGEATAYRTQMENVSGPDPLFNAVMLGEKHATFDMLVQLVGVASLDAYFFAQVKTTRRGLRPRSRTLPTPISKADVRLALQCPIPSYLLSVDDQTRAVYITAIDGRMRGGVSTVATTHPLDLPNARRLWGEVQSFWRRVRRPRWKSHFSI
jgi:hypothetical protein